MNGAGCTIMMALLASLVVTTRSPAQRVRSADRVAAGTFRGRIADAPPLSGARDGRGRAAAHDQPVGGSASWRYETDTLDWRRKLTIRMTLDRPGRPRIVVRLVQPDLPAAVVVALPAGYYALSPAAPHQADDWILRNDYRDTVMFAGTPMPTRGSVIRGRLQLNDYRVAAASGRAADATGGLLIGEFAAAFDPRPAPSAVAMSDSLQQALLERAVWDGGLRWLDAQVHVRANDSTHDAGLLRAFLTARYSNAVRIDTVWADNTHVFLRASGRYAPVACDNDGGHVRCWSTRGWRGR